MTKHEIKEYLQKIYQLPVLKVRTMNYAGKRKRLQSSHGVHFYKYKDFKKAVVTFDSSLQDVGMGMRVPELDDEDGDNRPYEDEDDAMDYELQDNKQPTTEQDRDIRSNV